MKNTNFFNLASPYGFDCGLQWAGAGVMVGLSWLLGCSYELQQFWPHALHSHIHA